MVLISDFDLNALRIIRGSVKSLISRGVAEYENQTAKFLDIAPQIYEGVSGFIEPEHTLHTLDISPEFHPTFVGDICATNLQIPASSYDAIFMTEVIEHVLNPQAAINEVYRMLKPRGRLFASSPFNFRIHGPLPDCWRISEHGWRQLLGKFDDLIIEAENDITRPLMPIHYRIFASKPD